MRTISVQRLPRSFATDTINLLLYIIGFLPGYQEDFPCWQCYPRQYQYFSSHGLSESLRYYSVIYPHRRSFAACQQRLTGFLCRWPAVRLWFGQLNAPRWLGESLPVIQMFLKSMVLQKRLHQICVSCKIVLRYYIITFFNNFKILCNFGLNLNHSNFLKDFKII